MKTLADFKRAIQPGTLWEGYNHLYNTRLKPRYVSKVQSNAFYLKTTRDNGETVDSRCDFPAACDVEFREDGTIDIYFTCLFSKERRKQLSYKQII